MSWDEVLKAENLIALSSFFAAGASFYVSWLSFKRDSGRLDFYVGVSDILNGQTLRRETSAINFRIVNSGRRPLIVTQVGGDSKCFRLIALLSKISSKFQPRAFILHSAIATAALTVDGRPRLLNEGEEVSFQLPLPAADEILEKIAKSESIYIFDTIGRKHRTSRMIFQKLKRDFKYRSQER